MPWWKALERMNEIIMFYFDDIVHVGENMLYSVCSFAIRSNFLECTSRLCVCVCCDSPYQIAVP